MTQLVHLSFVVCANTLVCSEYILLFLNLEFNYFVYLAVKNAKESIFTIMEKCTNLVLQSRTENILAVNNFAQRAV